MENDVEVSKAMPKKKKRLLGFGLDSDEEENGNGAVEELKMYEKERKLKFDEDPFLWWRGNRGRYPFMSRLARKYLAVQVFFIIKLYWNFQFKIYFLYTIHLILCCK